MRQEVNANSPRRNWVVDRNNKVFDLLPPHQLPLRSPPRRAAAVSACDLIRLNAAVAAHDAIASVVAAVVNNVVAVVAATAPAASDVIAFDAAAVVDQAVDHSSSSLPEQDKHCLDAKGDEFANHPRERRDNRTRRGAEREAKVIDLVSSLQSQEAQSR